VSRAPTSLVSAGMGKPHAPVFIPTISATYQACRMKEANISTLSLAPASPKPVRHDNHPKESSDVPEQDASGSSFLDFLALLRICSCILLQFNLQSFGGRPVDLRTVQHPLDRMLRGFLFFNMFYLEKFVQYRRVFVTCLPHDRSGRHPH
jgi:hypothetical protein